jgi:DNA invertase Pin-like site-specific DNA recombinase
MTPDLRRPIRRAAIHTRVSTARTGRYGDRLAHDQNPAVQEAPLRELVAGRGWEVVKVYGDRASGAKEERPALQQLMADARRGAFDVLLVWRFDRFARSVRQLVVALEEFRALGIDFLSHQEAVDTSTPMGKAMFTIIAAMAELERSLIRERIHAGLNYARANGTKSGRALGRPRRVFHRDAVAELRQAGLSWRGIAARLGVGRGTAVRVWQALNGAPDASQKPAQGAVDCRRAGKGDSGAQ